MSSIYPQDAREWIALIAAISPIFIWAVTGLFRARIQLSEKREAEWRRLHELADILNNTDGSQGRWNQQLAAQELTRLTTRTAEAKILAAQAADHFESTAGTSTELIKMLRSFENKQ